MRLETVAEPPGKGFTAQCQTCKQWIPAGTTEVADLDGAPFKAYYHTTCIPTQAQPHQPQQAHHLATFNGRHQADPEAYPQATRGLEADAYERHAVRAATQAAHYAHRSEQEGA